MSVCLFVYLCHCKAPSSSCRGDFWLKNMFLILACDKTFIWIYCYRFFCFFLFAVLDQPTLDSGGVSRRRSVAVGCWLFALQRHFNGTSAAHYLHFNGTLMALPWHFHNTSAALQWHFHNTSKALPWHFHNTSTALKQQKNWYFFSSIRIDREIQYLPYAVFLLFAMMIS